MKKPIADKKFGQHYLKNPQIIQQICDTFPKDCDAIVEVGPGPATLTKTLAQLAKPLYLIETDLRFKELLGELNTQKVFFQDALQFDWTQFLNDENLASKSIWLISNLPYNISVPLTMSFLKVSEITHMTLMYQKEVGEKILESDKTNSLNVLLNTYFQTKQLMKLKPGAFQPPPEVDSIVLTFDRIKASDDQLLPFESFLRTCFAQKRKQLAGLLKESYSRELVLMALEEIGVYETIRAEDMTRAQLTALYQKLRHE